MFSFLKNKSNARYVPPKDAAYELYMLAMSWSRDEDLYKKWLVPDTLEGRFDLLALHLSLLLDRLEIAEDKKQAKSVGQKLFETFIQNMDQSLREKGVGDMGVPRRMRAMLEGFNGRHSRYRLIFSQWRSGDEATALDALKTALAKNVYYKPELEIETILEPMMRYVIAMIKRLSEVNDDALLNADKNAITQVEII